MFRLLCIASAAAFAASSSALAHEIRYGKSVTDRYNRYSFLIGDWDVSDAKGGRPFVTLKYHWGPNHAYILSGAYIAGTPHYEGMMMWNGVHHNLDVLLATDMQHGLAQESGSVIFRDGAVIQLTTASYSEGVSAGGPVAGPNGATQRTRQTMHSIDADHVALSVEVETPTGWKPMMAGGDHLLMTRTASGH